MNPFQRAREEAVALRRKLLGAHAEEAIHVKEFLTPTPIEVCLELGLFYVAQGSTELGDSEAILRRSEDAIYVRKTFTESQRAYLVAHELGHFVLDDEHEDVTGASLKALTGAEGTPALITIESYGLRERQELRANVFARELLLPRAVARKLFANGLGPARVALDYGIDLEVARQQMLDAVLLPALTPPTAKHKRHEPTQDQKEAAEATERFANVVAGPGSGKTLTLVERVRYLIDTKQVPPSQILVLTFTNKAAVELVERLRLGGIAKASDVWAGTFHAFGLEFLRKYHHRFGLDADLVVADRLNAITLLNGNLPHVELKHFKRIQDPYTWLPGVVSAIKRLKEEMVTPAQYLAAIKTLGGSDDEQLMREDVAMLYERHEVLMQKRKFVDFVDLVAMPARALAENRPHYGELADKFQYVLVDEYQDVTFAMVQLIKQLAQNAKSLWVVGDVRQAIHHWRGASVDSLRRFAQVFKEQASTVRIREYSLALNRRSSPQILDLVKHVGRKHLLEKTLPLKETTSTECTGPLPELISCNPGTTMRDAVVDAVARAHKEGLRYGQQAVLSRDNLDNERYAARLREAGIPVLYVGELARRPEVKRLICLMQLLVERSPRALVGLTGIPGLTVDLNSLRVLIDACAANPHLQRGGWLQEFPGGLSPAATSALANVRELLLGQRRSANPWGFVCDLLLERRWNLPSASDVSIDAHATRIALWQFAYVTRAGDAERKIPTLPRFLLRHQLRQRIRETYHDRELPAEAAALDAVHIFTVHSSKGLEFDAVHVTEVNTNDYGPKVPAWRMPSILDIVPPEVLNSQMPRYLEEAAIEMNNLLYVAVSRARRRLFIYEDGERDNRNNRAPQMTSAGATVSSRHFSSVLKAGAPAAPKLSVALSTRPMPLKEFESYARCPLQYQYQTELQLPQETSTDIAIRSQAAVNAALRAWSADRTTAIEVHFEKAWEERRLPESVDDAQLHEHAIAVLRDGAHLVQETSGVYASPLTKLNGLKIELSSVLVAGKPGDQTIHVLKVAGGSLDSTVRMMRPMLNDLQPRPGTRVEVHGLLENKDVGEGPSGWIEKTAAYKAVDKLKTGDREAVVGRHCSWCPYSTLCPTKPSA